MKHTILFMAANPSGTGRLALDEEARAIQMELEQSGFRHRFEFVTRWAVRPLDLLRDLRKLKPTVVHFSGHGAPEAASQQVSDPGSRRDVVGAPGYDAGEPQGGLYFLDPEGRPHLVSTKALEKTFGAAGSSIKLVVLSACYSDVQARALLRHVGCVVGMSGAIRDKSALSFSIGFYGGLGEGASVTAAYDQGCAAIHFETIHDGERPKLAVRAGVDASALALAEGTSEHITSSDIPATLHAIAGLSRDALLYLLACGASELAADSLVVPASFVRSSNFDATHDDILLHTILGELTRRRLIEPREGGQWDRDKNVALTKLGKGLFEAGVLHLPSTIPSILWVPMFAIRTLFQRGIRDHLQSCSSISGDDAVPIVATYRIFTVVRAQLTDEDATLVDDSINVAADGFNRLIAVFREALSASPARQVELTTRAEQVLQQALLEYDNSLTRVLAL